MTMLRPTTEKLTRARVDWLIRFEGMDLDSRRPFTYEPLRRQAHRLFTPALARIMQLGELRDVQQRVRDGLAALRDGRTWHHRVTVDTEAVLLPPRGGLARGRGGVEAAWARWPIDTFLLTAMDSLVTIGDRLRACRRDGCRRLFLAVKRQQHCAECAEVLQRARVNDWRRRHPERVHAWAHRAYVKRRRDQFGPRIRVVRRPRKKSGKEAEL